MATHLEPPFCLICGGIIYADARAHPIGGRLVHGRCVDAALTLLYGRETSAWGTWQVRERLRRELGAGDGLLPGH